MAEARSPPPVFFFTPTPPHYTGFLAAGRGVGAPVLVRVPENQQGWGLLLSLRSLGCKEWGQEPWVCVGPGWPSALQLSLEDYAYARL